MLGKYVRHTFYLGSGQMGVYPLFFWSIGDTGQTRPRKAPARAPDCPKFSSDALAKVPAGLAEHVHLFFSFSKHVVGSNGTAAHEGL